VAYAEQFRRPFRVTVGDRGFLSNCGQRIRRRRRRIELRSCRGRSICFSHCGYRTCRFLSLRARRAFVREHHVVILRKSFAWKCDFVVLFFPSAVLCGLKPRLDDETGSKSWLDERLLCAQRAGFISWLSRRLNGVILQTFAKLI